MRVAMKQVSDGMPVQHDGATEDGASVIPSSGEQSRCDPRDALALEVAENPQRVQGALPTRAKDRHEDLLRVRRPPGAIASADFTIHDGGAERLFRAPVRRVDRGVVQEAEERRPFAVEMGRKPAHGGDRAALVEERPQARLQVPARHRQAMIRDGACGVPIAQGQRLLQHVVHPVWEQRAGMIGLQFA